MMNSNLFNYCLVKRSIVFTGASATFLLMYLVLWNSHTDGFQISSQHDSSSHSDSLTYQPITTEKNQIIERVTYCDYAEFNSGTVRNNEYLPIIYFVTPTYARSVQIAELTRLGQTLVSIPALHWILVEDSISCNPVIGKLLRRLGVSFTHLTSEMPAQYLKHKIKPRGVSSRRAALDWIRKNVYEGVLYFGDDDNTYDFRLFEEIRDTRNISMFPVGLIGDYSVSAPVVSEGKIVGFYDSWPAGRQFAVDMAGFAVNIKLLHKYPNATIIYKAGYEEDNFLKDLVADYNEIEPKAQNCTQVLVWHTKTVQTPQRKIRPPKEKPEHSLSSIDGLLHALDKLKLAIISKKGKPSSINYLKEI